MLIKGYYGLLTIRGLDHLDPFGKTLGWFEKTRSAHCVCIIYIYICVYTYIYIYIYACVCVCDLRTLYIYVYSYTLNHHNIKQHIRITYHIIAKPSNQPRNVILQPSAWSRRDPPATATSSRRRRKGSWRTSRSLALPPDLQRSALPAWWEIYKSRGQRKDMYIVLNSDILWYIYIYIYVCS